MWKKIYKLDPYPDPSKKFGSECALTIYTFTFICLSMGMTKKDLSRKRANLKTRLEELEAKARMDPLKRNRALYDEIEIVKRKLAESD